MSSVDIAIEEHADHDIQSLTQTAQTQTQILWMAASVGVVFIILGFITLNRLMLRPLSRISHALNAEAKGLDNVELPIATAIETKICSTHLPRCVRKSRRGRWCWNIRHCTTH